MAKNGVKREAKIGRVILSAQVYKVVQSGQQDNKVIAAKCGCTLGQVEKIRKEFEI